MVELTEDNLKDVLGEHESAIVQYGASWCGNCRIMKPKVKDLVENKYSNVTFIYADAEKFPGSRELAEIKNLPTFAVFKNGELVNQAMGTRVEKVEELLNEVTNH